MGVSNLWGKLLEKRGMIDKPMSFEPPSAKAEATGRGVGPADADKATGTTDKPAGKVADKTDKPAGEAADKATGKAGGAAEQPATQR